MHIQYGRLFSNNMAFSTVFTMVLILVLVNFGNGSIEERLNYFETLKASDFTQRIKRSSDPQPSAHIKEVKVTTLGRDFHLFLKPSKILSAAFKASVVRGDGSADVFDVNRGSIFTGSVAGDADAVANFNYEEDGTILANIVTKDDTYVIEPSWRVLPKSGNHSMVAYKKSDIKFEYADNGQHKNSVCGIKEGREDPELHGHITVDEQGHRYKRASPFLAERTTCQLMAVADYTFYEHMGGSSAASTALYLINVIQFVNTIYRETQFDSKGKGMIGVGFEIAEMRIHSEPTIDSEKLQGRQHYNAKKGHWPIKDLLEAFSFDKYFLKYCLAHLFTYRRFEDGVLGLAYIASDRQSAVGGICSRPYPKYPGVSMTLNTGWSSSLNSGGHRLLALQAQLVTSHEFGHNMGSEHDPETKDCAPSEYKDGKYIMYPWAVSGYDKNNRLFSPCSREYVFKVLKVKGYDCFVEGRGDGAFCGNGRVDPDEECDAGYHTKNNIDPCCDSQCKLRQGKRCSPMNYGCCSDNCQASGRDKVCRAALEGSCDDVIKCDGINITCPKIDAHKPDKTPCIDQGTCDKKGRCLNFCENHNIDFVPCICGKHVEACHRCCKPNIQGGICTSMNNTFLPDGRPCYQGICTAGTCEKKSQDMVQRLFDIIEDISIDTLVEFMKSNIVCTVIIMSMVLWIPASCTISYIFMKSNIVCTVIIMSMVLWIPASCTISYIDKKQNRKERARRNWMSRSNRTLYMEDDIKMRRANPSMMRFPKHSIVRNREHGEPTVRWPEGSVPRPVDVGVLRAGLPPPRNTSPPKPIQFPLENTESDDYGFRPKKKQPLPLAEPEEFGFRPKKPVLESTDKNPPLDDSDEVFMPNPAEDEYGFKFADDSGPDKETIL